MGDFFKNKTCNCTTQQTNTNSCMTFYRSKEDSSYAGYHLSYEVKKLMYASISQSSALSIDFVSFALSFGMNVVYLFDIYPCSLYSPLVYVSFGIFTFHFLLSLIRRRYSAPHFIRSTKHLYFFTFLNLISARFQFRSIHFLKVSKQTWGSWLPSRDEATFFCASYFLPVVRFRSAFFFITFGSVRFLLFVYTHFLFSFSFQTFDII
jgi:hypothetical protein